MANSILIVDDEPQFERLITQRFSREVFDGTFEFHFAESGIKALEIIEQDPSIDMVLTDINMPIMDGLTLLSKLKEKRPLLKTVIVSAYGDMYNIRKAMNLGAFDFITKPIHFGDLRTTIYKTLEEVKLIKSAQQAKALALHNEKLQELDQLKSHFFTNISHELRTPLSIITGVANQLREDSLPSKSTGIEMIERNSKRLLDLVNQILDLRKLESGKMQLQLIQADIIPLCHYVVDSFKYVSDCAGIQLHFLSDELDLLMDHDTDKLLRILSNLLSNSIKHTEEGGNIYLMVSKQTCTDPILHIKVKDTGKGIATDQLPFIFDRFYQDPDRKVSGTGVGLSLVQELVQLMGGTIDVESQPNKGTIFTIRLPMNNTAPIAAQVEPSSEQAQLTIESATNLTVATPMMEADCIEKHQPSLLIVEDNEDVIIHLLHGLNNLYHPIIARNGQEGIDLALEHIPDIIISDVMMPQKDGFELCEALKNDVRTSHIPIVLLTAKVDIENRIAGLSRGADAYLGKPFEQKELKAVLQQLLQQRLKLQAHYANLDITQECHCKDQSFSLEDAFLRKAKQLVEENLSDNLFSVQHFCRGMGMSYSVIHRKLAALTDKSPALFIRTLRLHSAKKMLNDESKSITDIAYNCGFSDPKYFSRTFSKEFGIPPSAFRS